LEAAGMGIPLEPGSVSLRINLCAVLPDAQGQLVIHSHNGGGIHGDDALALMNDLLAHPDFAALLRDMGLSISVTDTFRHIGVIRSGPKDLSALHLTEPHNVLTRPIEAHLPRLTGASLDVSVVPADTEKLCQDIRRLMLLSHEVLQSHPVNQKRMAEGILPANMLWPWGAATAAQLLPFQSLFSQRGAVISAVPLVWGIASLAGLDVPKVEGANGELNTNYEGKADAALHALLEGGYDFAAVHVEAPDEMAHAGDLAKKLEAIQNVEARVVARLLTRLTQSGQDFRLLLISDHPTLLTTRMHDGSPVPFALYDSRLVKAALDAGQPAPKRKFCEEELASEPVLMDGTELMKLLFESV
jgi:2,3-bisphosphoglycerate-independent phosphoglycerate mutase